MSTSSIRFLRDEERDHGSEGVVDSAVEDNDSDSNHKLLDTTHIFITPGEVITPDCSSLVCKKCGRVGDHLTISCHYGIGMLASKYVPNTISLRNLPEDTDWSGLFQLCRTYGPIFHIFDSGLQREGKRVQGLVAFESYEDAKMAIEKLNGSTFNHHVLTVEWAKDVREETKNVPDPLSLIQEYMCESCDQLTKDCRCIKGKMIKKYDQNTILIRNLAEDTDRSDLKWLCRTYGPVARVYEPRLQSEGMRDLGLVAFENKEDAQMAIEKLNGSTFNHHVLTVEWSKSVPDTSSLVQEIKCKSCGDIGGHLTKDCHHASKSRLIAKYVDNTIRVASLTEDTDRLELIELCSSYGPVKRVSEKKDYFAITFENKKDAGMAIEKLNGSIFNQRVLTIEWWADWAVKAFPLKAQSSGGQIGL